MIFIPRIREISAFENKMNVFEVKNLNKGILKNTLKTRHDIEG